MNELSCDRFGHVSAELALGLADAHERAAALAHLEHCPACRAEIRGLSDVADALAAMAPAAEPPAGFESRVLDHLAELARPPAAWRVPLRRVLQAAAAMALAGGIGLAGWLIGDAHGPAPSIDAGHLATAKLLAGGQKVGDVIVDTDGTPWMSMQVHMDSANGQFRCRITTTSGRTEEVGTFAVSGGTGMWAAPLPAGTGPLRAAQLVDGAGQVMATAAFEGG